MIAGEAPFQPRNDMEAAEMHGTQPPPRLVGRRPGIATEVEMVVFKAINKIPRDRFQTAKEFADSLRYVQQRMRGEITDGRYTIITPDPVLESEEYAPSVEQYLTRIQQEQEKLPEFQLGVEVDLDVDRIIVKRNDLTILALPVKEKGRFIVGRDPDVEISLNSDAVSRNHAVIERESDGKFTITDMGSVNGTYVNGVKMLSNVIEPWTSDQIITIGEFELYIERARRRRSISIGGEGFGTLGGVGLSTGATGGIVESHSIIEEKPTAPPEIIEVTIEPVYFTVEAGSRHDVVVNISNRSDIVEHYRVLVQGIPNEWVYEPPTHLQLLPGMSGSLTIHFAPARKSTSTAGTHLFFVRIASEERRTEVARVSGMITIPPFNEYGIEVYPKSIRKYGIVQLIINNKGNAPDSYTTSGYNKDRDVRFIPPNASVVIAAGLSHVIEIEVRPARGRLVGGKKTFNYEIETIASNGEKKTDPGELTARGVFPVWVVALLMLLCIGLIMLYFLFFRPRQESAVAVDNPATATNTGLRDMLTTTAIRNQTLTFVKTATADFIFQATSTAFTLEDPDGDGLINLEEQKVGSDPNLFDTDSDGLNDKEEVDLGTNPLVNDTDEDTLLDGDEVRIFGTSPRKNDTDGDTLLDNIELEQTFTDPNQVDTDQDGATDGEDTAPLDPIIPAVP
jgi:hypothetical protein